MTDIFTGMFLYAKLVMHVARDHRTLPEIQAEVENLPDGLNQAFVSYHYLFLTAPNS